MMSLRISISLLEAVGGTGPYLLGSSVGVLGRSVVKSLSTSQRTANQTNSNNRNNRLVLNITMWNLVGCCVGMFFLFFDAPNEMSTIKVTMQKDFSLFLKLKLLTFQDYFPVNQSNRNFNTILSNAEKLTSRF
jgi:hypothetical protein